MFNILSRLDELHDKMSITRRLLDDQDRTINKLHATLLFPLRGCDDVKQSDSAKSAGHAIGVNHQTRIPMQLVLEAILNKLDVTISYTGEGKVDASVELKQRGEENV